MFDNRHFCKTGVASRVPFQLQQRGFWMESKFAQRSHDDGSVDSICLQCYRTIAVTLRESDREALEASHVCTVMDLAALFHPDDRRQRSR
jgi:hypothetical protein